MKSSICNVCLKSDLLCPSCQEKLDKKEVSERELELFRKVSRLSDKFKGLKDVDIEEIIEDDRILVIVCSKGDISRIVGKGGYNVKSMGKAVGKMIRIVEDTNDYRKFLQDLVFPTPIVSFSLVYSTEGEIYKIKFGSSQLPIPAKSFKNIARKKLGKKVKLEFPEVKKETTEEKIRRLIKKMEQ